MPANIATPTAPPAPHADGSSPTANMAMPKRLQGATVTGCGQLSLFGVATASAPRAKITNRHLPNLAKVLMVAYGRCETCGIARCHPIYGQAADGRECLSPNLGSEWLDVETGKPAVRPVEHDGFPPSIVELAAYYIKSKNVVVVRCERHSPQNGKKVEVQP